MAKKKSIADQIFQLYQSTKTGDREKWIKSSEKAYNFFLGNQLTEDEIRALNEKKMPTFTINKITPQIELMKYFLTARSPRWQAVGVDEADTDDAEIHAKVAQHVWKNSRGQTVLSQVVQDALSKSLGYIKVGIDPDQDNGMGEVVVEHEEPWDVVVDPHSKDPFFRDASFILIYKDMTIEKAASEYPEFSEAEIRKYAQNMREGMQYSWNSPVPTHNYELSDAYDSEGKANEFIKFFEFYRKKKIQYVNVYLKLGGEVQNYIMPLDEWRAIKREDRKLPEDKQVYPDSIIIEEIEFKRPKIFRTECLGSKVLEEEVEMPGTIYPIIPLPYRHTGTPYPMSVAMDLTGKQEEINKAHQIMIHHANLSSVPRWVAQAGQISDVDEWERNSSTPGKVLIYNPAMDGQSAPNPIQPLPLNSAFYTLTEKGASDMEYISGMSHYMMGQGERSGREPYRGLLAQDDFGTRRVRGFATNVLNEFMGIVGQVVDSYARELYRAEKTIMIANPDDPDLIERHVINPVTEENLKKFYDKRAVNYNMIFVGGSTLLVNRWAELEQMIEMYQMNIVDRTSVLMKTDIGNKKAIMQKMDQIYQLSSQLEQAQDAIKDLEKRNNILEQQVVNTRIAAKVADANIDVNAEKESFIYQLKGILQDTDFQSKEIQQDITHLIDKIENEQTNSDKKE